MKIILTQEVSGLGAPGDVVEVKDGYGRNYLLPQGYAILWTRGSEKQVSLIKRARDARQIRDLGNAQKGLGEETTKVAKDNLPDAVVFARILRKAAKAMDDAAQ